VIGLAGRNDAGADGSANAPADLEHLRDSFRTAGP